MYQINFYVPKSALEVVKEQKPIQKKNCQLNIFLILILILPAARW
jgi:hypothetical protein